MFANIHHLYTTSFTLQQCLDFAPRGLSSLSARQQGYVQSVHPYHTLLPTCAGLNAMGTELIHHVLNELLRAWLAPVQAGATLLKAQVGPRDTMARAIQEVRLHQQTELQGVPRVPLTDHGLHSKQVYTRECPALP